jgi:hypothetical protein
VLYPRHNIQLQISTFGENWAGAVEFSGGDDTNPPTFYSQGKTLETLLLAMTAQALIVLRGSAEKVNTLMKEVGE